MGIDQESYNEYHLFEENNKIKPGEIVIGELIGFNDNGEPQVSFLELGNEPISALSTMTITHEHKGRKLALLFANGDLNQPIIMGIINNPLLDLLSNVEIDSTSPVAILPCENDDVESSMDNAHIDGKRVVLEGKEEIVLKCGDASITLTKSGRILIKGKYLLNRSSGVNRIMGGSVKVN